MTKKDYYKTLGINKDASKEEIKKAYKKMAKQYHPDLNEGDTEAEKKFKEVNEAASVLGDDNKRAQYDQFGSEGMKYGGAGGPGGGFGGFNFSGSGFDFNDIFDSFFGGGGGGFNTAGRRGPRQGADLRYDLDVTLEEVATGVDKKVKMKKKITCNDCDGHGGHGITTCAQCGGKGVTTTVRRTPFGAMQTQTTCNACNGMGEVVDEVCTTCQGKGFVHGEKTIKITIPEGIEDGMRLRMQGEGEPGEPGAPAGDLYIFIHEKNHQFFRRDGTNLYIEVPITFSQAVFGDKITVPTITGKAELKIPSGTQPGTLLRMKNKGLPHVQHSDIGDQYVKIQVEVPTSISRKQKEALKDFEKGQQEKKPHERLFEKIKSAFE
ncbi:molecular chaperone DnaJ [Candidatus Woesearchaeota archaeon]|nr:molecular chaperone DnaJ [Candidatus Woesearchaeota archaeon]